MRLLAKGPHTSNSISDSLDSGHPYEGGLGRVGDVTFYINATVLVQRTGVGFENIMNCVEWEPSF